MLTFSGEYWSISTVGQGVFSNEAMWIMDYIMAYTVATAAIYILRGWRRIAALLIICVIAGPTVVLMSPLWFTGILAFEIDKRLDEGLAVRIGMAGTRVLRNMVKRRARMLALLTMIGAFVLILVLEGNQLGEGLYQWSKTIVSYDYRQYLGMAKRLGNTSTCRPCWRCLSPPVSCSPAVCPTGAHRNRAWRRSIACRCSRSISPQCTCSRR